MELYKVIFNPDNDAEDGIYAISLVDDPAIGRNFIALSNVKPLKFKSVDTEKRLLIGPVLIPDQKIYRDWYGGCEIFFDAETIRLASQEFMKNSFHKNSTYNHNSAFLKNVTFVDSWIISDMARPSNDEFKDLPDGTWMVSMKVDSDEIWNDFVKTDKVKGFSIDALFSIEKLQMKLEKKQKTNMRKEGSLLSSLRKLINMAEDDKVYVNIEVEDLGMLYFEDLLEGYVIYKDELATEPIGEVTFVYEGKEVKTDADGKVISITDVPVESEVEVELRKVKEELLALKKQLKLEDEVQLWEYVKEDGGKVYACWLGLGELITDESKAAVASQTFSVQGLSYTTDAEGRIETISKDAESPFWRKEDVKVEDVVTEEVAMKAVKMDAVEDIAKVVEDRTDELADIVKEAEGEDTVEALKAKIQELLAEIDTMKGEVNKVKEESVEMKKVLSNTPAAVKLTSNVVEDNTSNKQKSRRELFDSLKK